MILHTTQYQWQIFRILGLWPQSRWHYCKLYIYGYVSVYRRKNSVLHSMGMMGMIPKVFVHNLHGNVSHSFCALKFVTKILSYVLTTAAQ